MGDILKLSENLYVDLSTGICRRTKVPMPSENTEKLTKGEIVVLNYLVRNKEVVCSNRSLEELLESDMGESSCPCIKQYLTRIRSKLKAVDVGFDKKMASKVFEAARGVGYIFHLPNAGEIIKTKVFADMLIQVDLEFINAQKVKSQIELENLKNVFYGITSDIEVIMRAVCNELVVKEPEYRILLSKLSSYILNEKTPTGPVCLMADAGAGKSSLLCSLAVQTSRDYPNWKVYYLRMEGIDNIEETFHKIRDYTCQRGSRNILLCIDNPHKNPNGFKELYQQLLMENELHIYTVIAERVSYMLNIFESSEIYQRNSYIRGVYIDNTGYKNDSKKYLRSSVVQFYDLKVYRFSVELEEKIVSLMIKQLVKRKKLDQETVEQSITGLKYENRTIIDIFMDFERRYNAIAEQREDVAREYYIPRIEMDWDEWKIKCRDLDKDCIRLKLSEAFPYIAVCSMIGIYSSFEFVYKMTGYPYKSELLRLFPRGMGESIQFDDDHFKLRHDSVAHNFFACHREISPLTCMKDMIIRNYMDEITAVMFAREVFIFFMCSYQFKEHYCIEELQEMLMLFMKNEDYMRSIWKNNRAHLMEFAYLIMKYNWDFSKNGKLMIQDEFSQSFLRTVATTSNLKVQIFYWETYVKSADLFCEDIPESLVQFVENVEFDKAVLLVAALHKINEQSTWVRKKGDWVYFSSFAEIVCQKIILQYPDNLYAYKTLAGIRLGQNRRKEARSLIRKWVYNGENEDVKGLYELLDIFDEDLESYKDSELVRGVYVVTVIISELYEDYEKQKLYTTFPEKIGYYQYELKRYNYPYREPYTNEVAGILMGDLSMVSNHMFDKYIDNYEGCC